jgi:hypothetical protein
MLTEIPLVIQIIKCVYMIPPLIPPIDGISATDAGIPPKRDENSHINTSSRLVGTKKLGGMNFSLLSIRKCLFVAKYDVKHLNGFIPAMYFVHINTRRVSRLGGMKTSRPV